LDVLLHVVVDADLTLRRAHDIGEAVELRLIEEGDVCHAVVHVDVDDERGRRKRAAEGELATREEGASARGRT